MESIISFEIINILFLHKRGQFIFARILDDGINFEIKEGATFGGIPIYHYLEMPRLIDEKGIQRFDVFVFRPLKPLQKGNLVEGQKVELIIPK
jgi:hypothetical protein